MESGHPFLTLTGPTMPSQSHRRQPDRGFGWFASEAGQGLLEVESAAQERLLNSGPTLPWLWMGVQAAAPPLSERRGICLRKSATGGTFHGALQCSSTLPLASESFGAVLIQHALDDAGAPEDLLTECERILTPGGSLWLAALNPLSPYRLRWSRSGLHARPAGRWQAALKRAGFALDSVHLQWIGPRWRTGRGEAGVAAADRLRAGMALTIIKRPYALIPPRPVRAVSWQPGGATSQPLGRRPAIMRR